MHVLRFAGVFFFIEIGLDPDVSDEPQWYIPAGINLPDLQRTLTVIEQFETSPLDLEGKRAAQLLHKKRRPRRRRRRQPTTNTSGSEEEDDDGGKVARKAREREKYMSAQFIEDSDEEYGRDIEGFFEREAALRERTALAAVDSLSHIGTMRPTGTKKRRRAQPSLGTAPDAATAAKGRQAKRTRRSAALSAPGMHDGGGEGQGEGGDRGGFNAGALRPAAAAAATASFSDDGDDDGGDDGSGGRDIDHSDSSSRSFFAHRDSVAGKHRLSDPPAPATSNPPRPRARPRFRGVPVLPSHAPDTAVPDTPPRKGTGDNGVDDDDDVGQAQPGHDLQLTGASTAVLSPVKHKGGDHGRQASTPTSTSSSNGGGPRRGRRLIISDEEE